ncbi:hypothetical protein BFU36_03455 [Sulfolobus sp. A20]|nr:hypothetical protein BFU36_03455 [Sulfolobus sp. A20]
MNIIRYIISNIIVKITPTITRLPKTEEGTFPKAIGIGPIKISPANCGLLVAEVDWVVAYGGDKILANTRRKPINISMIEATINFIF